MSEQFTEVSEQGLGSNLLDSIKGVAVGGLLFILSFPVLWWNEGRTDLSQVAKMRVLGLVGYLTFAAGYLTMFATQMMAVFFLPALTHKSPHFVADVIVAADGGKPTGDIGHIQVLFNITGACYMLGGLMFGIALFRSGALARWASALLAVATKVRARTRGGWTARWWEPRHCTVSPRC